MYGFINKMIGAQPNAVNIFFLEQTIEHYLYLYQLGLSGQVEKKFREMTLSSYYCFAFECLEVSVIGI